MIVRLNGKLEYVGEDSVHVAVGDLTHELLVPAADIAELQPKVGQHISFFTLEYIEGNASFGQLAPKMLGFLRANDREFFDLFISVKGIGPRKALKAWAISTGDIATAIALKDARKLATLPQIGKRAAEQIIAELHGKVESFATGTRAAKSAAGIIPAAIPDFAQQAIEVLVKLGERRPEAENYVQRATAADPTLTDAQKIVQAVYRLKSGIA